MKSAGRPGMRWLAVALGAWSSVAGAGCAVSATGVAFGVYDPASATPRDINGSIAVTCSRDAGFFQNFNYTATFSTGGASSHASRRMVRSGGLQQLNYNLFTAGHAQVLGNGSAGTAVYSGSIFVWLLAPSGTTTHTMAGRIPAGQDAVPGSYLDGIVVTLSF